MRSRLIRFVPKESKCPQQGHGGEGSSAAHGQRGPTGRAQTPFLSPVPGPALGTRQTLGDSGCVCQSPAVVGGPRGGTSLKGDMAQGEIAVVRDATPRFCGRDGKEGVSLCEQGVLGGVIPDARAPGGGALGPGLLDMVSFCQGWWGGWGCQSYDLGVPARPPMTEPGLGASWEGFALGKRLFKGPRPGGGKGPALPGFQGFREARNR